MSDRATTPALLSQSLGVSVHTIGQWIASGELRAHNLARKAGGRPRWRIMPSDVDAFLAARAATPQQQQTAPKRKTGKSARQELAERFGL